MANKKHPKDMTGDELARHLFHPKVLKYAKKVATESKKSTKGK
jgi:hypothetical protein